MYDVVYDAQPPADIKVPGLHPLRASRRHAVISGALLVARLLQLPAFPPSVMLLLPPPRLRISTRRVVAFGGAVFPFTGLPNAVMISLRRPSEVVFTSNRGVFHEALVTKRFETHQFIVYHANANLRAFF